MATLEQVEAANDAHQFHVPGEPIPQGSMKSFGGTRITSDNPRLRAWRATVKEWAILTTRDSAWPIGGPVALGCHFYLPRPKYHYGTGRNAGEVKAKYRDAMHTVPADLDKLCRAIGDAITVSKTKASENSNPMLVKDGLLYDDGQIVRLWARKSYANSDPGVAVTVTPLEKLRS